MNIQEFYDSIDENYENVSSRMMGNQKLVEKSKTGREICSQIFGGSNI